LAVRLGGAWWCWSPIEGDDWGWVGGQAAGEPEEKSNLQALARVDHSIVALVGQCVPLICVFDNVPIPGLEDDVLVKLEAHIPS